MRGLIEAGCATVDHMFDSLQDKLQNIFRKLRGEGRVSPEILKAALREIRLALLEADVNFRVVKAFVARLEEKALDQEVLDSLTPAQQVLKIVRDELEGLLGEPGQELQIAGRRTVVLMVGLQGSGKTTTAGKLAYRLRQQGRRPLLVAGDLQRAAAVEQLQQVGEVAGAPVLSPELGEDLQALAGRALRAASDRGHDVVIFDSAGRLHVDEELMEEARLLAEHLQPAETLFVADAMIGQDAVKSAQEFDSRLSLTGVILSKMDGDSRGGAALSIRAVADVPIRYVGVGEKVDELELFQPDRLASRLLGMGDVLTLIEKAEQQLDAKESGRLAERLARQEFTLEDLRDQLRQLKRMGPLSQVLAMLPKSGPLKGLDPAAMDDRQLVAIQAMIDSMTAAERRNPKLLNGSRRRRIAQGSGTSVQEINRLLKQYRMMKKLMKGAQGKWLRGALKR